MKGNVIGFLKHVKAKEVGQMLMAGAAFALMYYVVMLAFDELCR